MFENFFRSNIIVIFIFCIFTILVSNKPNAIHKKMLLCYIFIIATRVFDILALRISLPIFFAVTFIYFEILIDDEFKLRIFKNYIYKLIDYIFLMIFNFKIFYFLLLAFFWSHPYQKLIVDYHYLQIAVYIVEIILLGYLLQKNSVVDFSIDTFDSAYSKMEKIDINDKKKIQELNKYEDILLYYEDRSFYERENKYTLLYLNYIKYKYQFVRSSYNYLKDQNQCDNIMKYYCLITIRKSIKILKMFWNYFFNGKALRGFSTIEMQLLRTVLVKEGYERKPKTRKMFEIIYTPMFFNGLKQYFRSNCKTITNHYYKQYILALYVQLAPVEINGDRSESILSLWKKQDISDLSREEFFIGVIGLSHRVGKEQLSYANFKHIYKREIESFKLELKQLKVCLRKLSKLTKS